MKHWLTVINTEQWNSKAQKKIISSLESINTELITAEIKFCCLKADINNSDAERHAVSRWLFLSQRDHIKPRGKLWTWIEEFQSLTWSRDLSDKMFPVKFSTARSLWMGVKNGFELHDLPPWLRPPSCGFRPSHWVTSCPRTSSFLEQSQFKSHPAARQSQTNMELNREIRSEYKQVMVSVKNTPSMAGSNVQQQQPCFPFTALGTADCLNYTW